ncbi:hypothetical protein [Streptomyces muensis]|uniref:Uncharacterized protein n=1 Tax=Streptomyces muensis TaxID=1077944 RepID=A0A9X1PU81_STRM4|nr:hypothetical protein [Streptomyces muensis]MCF1592349.1 hypothetical protein [Streptomyces muensis]
MERHRGPGSSRGDLCDLQRFAAPIWMWRLPATKRVPLETHVPLLSKEPAWTVVEGELRL